MHINLLLDKIKESEHAEASLLQPAPCFQVFAKSCISLQRHIMSLQ